MNKPVYELRSECPKCGIAFLAGSPASDWLERARARGLTKIARHPQDDLSKADAAYLGDLIDPETLRCPRCAEPAGRKCEVQWPERCGLCSKPPGVFWQLNDGRYVGLCYSCKATDDGRAWLARMSSS